MAKDNIFPLYLTAPVQNETATTASWNGSTSNVTYAPTGNATFTVGDAVETGTVLSIRKTNSTSNLSISANAETICTISNENDTVVLIWDGNDWQIYSLSDIPLSLSASSLALTGNLTVNGATNLGVATITQGTSRTTPVTINSTAGVITTNATASGAANTVLTFTVNNNRVTANSVVLLTIAETTTVPTYARVSTTAAGSFNISYAYSVLDIATSTKFNFIVTN